MSDGPVDRTSEIAPDVFVDLAADGDLVGVEILNPNHRRAEPMKLAFEILGHQDRQAAE